MKNSNKQIWLIVSILTGVVLLSAIAFLVLGGDSVDSKNKNESGNKVTQTATPTTSPTLTATPTVTLSPNQKTYTDQDLGFSFMYPQDFTVNPSTLTKNNDGDFKTVTVSDVSGSKLTISYQSTIIDCRSEYKRSKIYAEGKQITSQSPKIYRFNDMYISTDDSVSNTDEDLCINAIVLKEGGKYSSFKLELKNQNSLNSFDSLVASLKAL